MGKLRIVNPTVQSGTAQASPEDFGSAVGQELTALGREVRATTNSLVQNAVKPIARQNALEYGKALSAEVETIISDRGRVADWENDFEKAKGRIRKQFEGQLGGDTQTFRNAAGLTEQDNGLQLQNAKNAAVARASKAAFDATVQDAQSAILLATTDDQRGEADAMLEIAVDQGVREGNVFPDARDATIGRLKIEAASGGVAQSIAAGDLDGAKKLIDRYQGLDEVRFSAVKAQYRRAVKAELEDTETNEANLRARRSRFVSNAQARNEARLAERIHAAREGDDPDAVAVSLQEIRQLSTTLLPATDGLEGELAITPDQARRLEGLLKTGVAARMDGATGSQIVTMIYDPGTTAADLDAFMAEAEAAGALPGGSRAQFTKDFQRTRFGSGMDTIRKAGERLARGSGKAGMELLINDAENEFMTWVAGTPDATGQEVSEKVREILDQMDPRKKLERGITRVVPRWFQVEGDRVSVQGSRINLMREFKAGRMNQGQARAYMKRLLEIEEEQMAAKALEEAQMRAEAIKARE